MICNLQCALHSHEREKESEKKQKIPIQYFSESFWNISAPTSPSGHHPSQSISAETFSAHRKQKKKTKLMLYRTTKYVIRNSRCSIRKLQIYECRSVVHCKAICWFFEWFLYVLKSFVVFLSGLGFFFSLECSLLRVYAVCTWSLCILVWRQISTAYVC